jgi:hypothetical protein
MIAPGMDDVSQAGLQGGRNGSAGKQQPQQQTSMACGREFLARLNL